MSLEAHERQMLVTHIDGNSRGSMAAGTVRRALAATSLALTFCKPEQATASDEFPPEAKCSRLLGVDEGVHSMSPQWSTR